MHLRTVLAQPVLACLLVAACASDSPSPETAGAADEPQEVVVFAAASLRDVMTEIGLGFAALGGSTSYNFAGSNVLARQIEAAPAAADVYLSANEQYMDELQEAGLIDPSTRRALLGNSLVIVAHRDAPHTLERLGDLARLPFERLSLGDPRAVPAGIYARRALEAAGLWEEIEPRVVPAPDVRAARGLVEADPRTLGILYRTDARGAPRLRVLLEIPPESQPEIRYSAAVTASAPHPAAARRFLAHLESSAAAEVFEQHGFEPLFESPSR